MRMALLGASGCGKSVTLKCIAGIMTPDRGHIILDGETLFDSEKHINLPPQKRRIGYLFQQYALFPNMTVLQNIRCGIRSGSRAEKRRRAEEKLRRFRLEGLEKKYPAQLSGGQQQRTALLRAVPARKSAGKRGPRRRERPQYSTFSRTNACATSESAIARGTVFADIFADQAFTPSV